jgi:hypothetical protein
VAGLQNDKILFSKYIMLFFQYGGRKLDFQLENLQKPASWVFYFTKDSDVKQIAAANFRQSMDGD